MGACVVGGMLTSTVLTLIVIPVVYSIVDDMRSLGPRLLATIRRKQPAAPSQPILGDDSDKQTDRPGAVTEPELESVA
ncbi:MAG: hypothetical protein R3C56_19980 [Pirellulaceae bacterium]